MNLPLRVFLAMALTTWQANRAAGRPNLPAPTTRPAASPTSSSQATDADAPPGQPPVPAAQDLDDHVRLITDPNTPEARELGARKLLEAGSEAAARRLASILQSSSDPAAKQAVCRAIGRARSPMPALVEPLVQLLGTDPAALDTLIVAALRQFDRRAVIPRLEASAIETARPIQRRGSAIRALGDMGDDLSAVAALVRLLGDGEARIRRAVLEALEDATGVRHRDAAAALAWWESHESMTPLQWLREVNQRRAVETSRLYEQVAELTDRLVTAYREAYLRVPEAERLGKLLEFLGDPAPAVRGLGLDLINALITDRKDVGKEIKARLVEMIADPDPVIRRKVAVMAGDLRLTEAAARLQAAVSRETDARVRSAQVGALGRIDEIGAIPVLLARLSDESKEVVMEAATALGLLARRGHLEAPAVAPIASALLERFGALGPSDEEVSGRFLEAMGRIGAEAFRPVFRREIRSGHSLRLRAAAIAGLASFGDAEAAGEVRSLLAAPEPEIRLAAVQALGRCGRGSADLEALAERLDSGRETNQGIRDRVWESYTAIARRASPQAELKAAGRFATPADPPVQRRRLSLLRALKRNPARFGALTPGQQVELLDALSEAQLLLEEYDAASTSIDEAMKLLADAKHPTTRRLGRRLVAVLLRLGRDKEALERLQAFQSSGVLDGVAPEASPPIEIILSEARRRLAAADDAGKFAALLGLIDLARPIAAAASQPTRDALEQLEQEALDKRRTVIERLLGRLAQESDAEGKLIGFGRDLVLPGVRARLSEQPTTSAPAGDLEQALIALAKKLVPGWPGFAPGGPAEERAAALEQLRPAASASQPAGPG